MVWPTETNNPPERIRPRSIRHTHIVGAFPDEQPPSTSPTAPNCRHRVVGLINKAPKHRAAEGPADEVSSGLSRYRAPLSQKTKSARDLNASRKAGSFFFSHHRKCRTLECGAVRGEVPSSVNARVRPRRS
jgi:hypothetical protein